MGLGGAAQLLSELVFGFIAFEQVLHMRCELILFSCCEQLCASLQHTAMGDCTVAGGLQQHQQIYQTRLNGVASPA